MTVLMWLSTVHKASSDLKLKLQCCVSKLDCNSHPPTVQSLKYTYKCIHISPTFRKGDSSSISRNSGKQSPTSSSTAPTKLICLMGPARYVPEQQVRFTLDRRSRLCHPLCSIAYFSHSRVRIMYIRTVSQFS